MNTSICHLDARKYFPSLGAMRVSIFLAALLVFIAIDVAVFRSGFYYAFIEPSSSLGMYQFRTKLATARILSGGNLVAFVGDSRVQDGFSAQIFDSISGPQGCRAINLGVPASTPRIWFYMLKGVDPSCRAFRAIVISLPTYCDADEPEDLVDRSYDLHYLMPYLSFTDAVELIASYRDPFIQRSAAMQWLVKAFSLRNDLADFCCHPFLRLANLDHLRKYGTLEWYEYLGRPTSMDGIELLHGSWTRGTSHVSDVALHRLNARVFMPLPKQTGRRQKYNSYWLGKIVDRYSASNTKLVFLKIPSDPTPPIFGTPRNYATFKTLKRKHNVVFFAENYFDDLNCPKFFGDEIHMNFVGRRIFSTRLSRCLVGLLASGDCLSAASSSPFQ